MRKIILMLAFCGSLVAMSAQVNEPDRSIYGTGASTEQEDKSKMGTGQNAGVSGEKTMMQSDKDRCADSKKSESGKAGKHKYSVNTPNGTTGAQNDFMSGEGKISSSDLQADHSKVVSHQGTGKSEQGKTVHHKKSSVKSKTTSEKTGLTTMTYSQTPIPEDHTAVSVPEKVRNAFSNAYYNMKATWKQEGENYRAMFKSNDKEPLETIVVYDKTGKEIVVEKELKSDACPAAISKYCARNERIWEVFEKGKPMKYFIQEKGERNKWFDRDGNRIYGAVGPYERHGVASHVTRPYSK